MSMTSFGKKYSKAAHKSIILLQELLANPHSERHSNKAGLETKSSRSSTSYILVFCCISRGWSFHNASVTPVLNYHFSPLQLQTYAKSSFLRNSIQVSSLSYRNMTVPELEVTKQHQHYPDSSTVAACSLSLPSHLLHYRPVRVVSQDTSSNHHNHPLQGSMCKS